MKTLAESILSSTNTDRNATIMSYLKKHGAHIEKCFDSVIKVIDYEK